MLFNRNTPPYAASASRSTRSASLEHVWQALVWLQDLIDRRRGPFRTRGEVAAALGVSANTVSRWYRQKDYVMSKIMLARVQELCRRYMREDGKRIRVRSKAVLEYRRLLRGRIEDCAGLDVETKKKVLRLL